MESSILRGIASILLLIASNSFMTVAWYGHLKFKEYGRLADLGLWAVVLISWGIALFEYILQVPANRIGYIGYGGPFTLVQLKVLQEVITLSVFVGFSVVFFKDQYFTTNHLIGFVFLVLAVYFIFRR
jgi:uncharacterized protein (DUF486 family)